MHLTEGVCDAEMLTHYFTAGGAQQRNVTCVSLETGLELSQGECPGPEPNSETACNMQPCAETPGACLHGGQASSTSSYGCSCGSGFTGMYCQVGTAKVHLKLD